MSRGDFVLFFGGCGDWPNGTQCFMVFRGNMRVTPSRQAPIYHLCNGYLKFTNPKIATKPGQY